MRICTYTRAGERHIGFLAGDGRIADLAAAARASGTELPAIAGMRELVNIEHLPLLQAVEAATAGVEDADWLVPVGDVTLHAPYRPLQNPICAGGNTRDEHVGERMRGARPWLNYFTKATTSVNDPGAPICWPRQLTNQVYAEPQLAVIIGATTSFVAPDAVAERVFGYAVCTSVSSADLKRKHGQWDKAVSLDTFFSWGPYVVTADEVPLDEASGRLWLNDRMAISGAVQSGLLTTEEIVSELSFGMTLEPGDVVLTGVPESVGHGQQPERWLQDGDVVRSAIDGVGEIQNPVATY